MELNKPCLLWAGKVGSHGYGYLQLDRRTVLAHRLAFAIASGLDVHTMGGVVLHSCDTPLCVEPTHLSLGTHAANTADMIAKDRHLHGPDWFAANKGLTKLTPEIVAYCREHYVPRHKEFGARALARRFNVAHPQIVRAVQGKSWEV